MDENFELFQSPRLYLETARERLADVVDAIDEFERDCSFEWVRKLNNKTGDHEIWARASLRLPPKIRVNTSQLFEHLRHALDQAICDAARCRRPDVGLGDLEFPFASTYEGYCGKKKKIAGKIGKDVGDYIDGLKPYLGGRNELWAITKLAALKHRRAILLVPTSRSMELKPVDGIATLDVKELDLSKPLNLNNEFKFATLRPNAVFRGEVKFKPRLVFGENNIDVVRGLSVYSFSESSIQLCASIIDNIERTALGTK